jgi:hypothetical protein
MSEDDSIWTEDIETVLNNIRLNSVALNLYHKKRYYYLKEKIKWFRLPTICLSALNSVFSVGLQPFMPQNIISVVNCLISLICGIIVSVELFLSIETSMRREHDSSKEYYLLSVEIQKFLLLERKNRHVEGKVYLDKCYNQYVKLYENSCLLKKQLKDALTPAEEEMLVGITPTSIKNSEASASNSDFSSDKV